MLFNIVWFGVILIIFQYFYLCLIPTLSQSRFACLFHTFFFNSISLSLSLSLSVSLCLSFSLSLFVSLCLSLKFSHYISLVILLHSGLGKQHIGGPVVIFAYYGNYNFSMNNPLSHISSSVCLLLISAQSVFIVLFFSCLFLPYSSSR